VQITPELFEKREVKVGRNDGRGAEILSGLLATERVVTAGAVQIKLAQATGTLDAHSGHVH
jgi:multidrug efflux pump subunit AcrA (membrane-fusion protein)